MSQTFTFSSLSSFSLSLYCTHILYLCLSLVHTHIESPTPIVVVALACPRTTDPRTQQLRTRLLSRNHAATHSVATRTSVCHSTGRPRRIACLIAHVSVCKSATTYRALLRKVTLDNKSSHGSEAPYSQVTNRPGAALPVPPKHTTSTLSFGIATTQSVSPCLSRV